MGKKTVKPVGKIKKKALSNSKARVPAASRVKLAVPSSGNDMAPQPNTPAHQIAPPIVGIGASAGGLEALNQLLGSLGPNPGAAFVIVQHLAPKHESMLTEILSRATELPVSEVVDGDTVAANHVYIIPPNAFLAIQNGVLHLTPRAGSLGHYMPVDYFLQSLADDQGPRAVGVILSGTANDGTQGMLAIQAAGGVTFAQDEASAKFSGMPLSAIDSGSVDFVLPPGKIATEITRIVKAIEHLRPADDEQASDDGLQKIFLMLRRATGIDFNHYKHATIIRRIRRRMLLLNIKIPQYLERLQSDPVELEALTGDVLINVTSFFRDPEVFEALKTKLLPRLIDQREPGDPIRVWVPGCSTGEEPYSIAIAILEFIADLKTNFPIQIFATDVSEKVLDLARIGVYKAPELSPERLRRYFVRVDNGYQVSKAVRDVCIFAKQDVTRDPPFSRIDLVSCRNLLIYLGRPLQKRVMQTFHYALKPSGYLILGTSENIGPHAELFSVIDGKNKMFMPRAIPSKVGFDFGSHLESGAMFDAEVHYKESPAKGQRDMNSEVSRLILNKYTPAGVVVNDAFEIVQFRGHTAPYLEPAPGEASLNLLRMAREGLLLALRNTIQRAKATRGPVRREGIAVQSNGRLRVLTIEVIPLQVASPNEHYFLVLFQEEPAKPAAAGKKKEAKGASETLQSQRLQNELAATKTYLQSIAAEHESTMEDLRAASEEIQSSNEELQSTNEELETAKEELQSANEELITLNEELQNRNRDLCLVNSDLNNLLTTVSVPIVMLGTDLRIRRFTPTAGALLNIIPSDIGRKITDLKPNLSVIDLAALVTEVVDSVTMKEIEVQDQEGRWHLMRIRPYKNVDEKITGVVVAVFDINAVKRTTQMVQHAREYAESILQSVQQPLLVLDHEFRVITANASYCQTFRTVREDTENHFFLDLGSGQWNQPGLREVINASLRDGTVTTNYEMEQEFRGLGRKTLQVNVSRVFRDSERHPLLVLGIEDITQRKNLERQKDEFIGMASHELKTPLTTVKAFTQLLEERFRNRHEDESADYLRKMDGQIDKLMHLINDLLDISKIEAGKLVFRIQEFRLDGLIDEVLEQMQEAAEKHEIVRVGRVNGTVLADRDRVGQVLINLLSNAIKYSPPNSKIIVQAQANKENYMVSVQDFGVGVPKEDQPRIFERYFQAKGSKRDTFPGLGLGLYISSEIVKRQGGNIWVQSDEKIGATFYFTLPIVAKKV